MTTVTSRNFGYLVAYLLPGFLLLLSLSRHSPILQAWVGTASSAAPTLGGFLYVTVASVALGMVVSALRWLVLDWIHHRTGLRRPKWDFSDFERKHAAFELLAEGHYRYYQFYANTLVALVVAGALSFDVLLMGDFQPAVAVSVYLLVLALLFAASRDALDKYYARTQALLKKAKRQ